jgi:hypothetical protein
MFPQFQYRAREDFPHFEVSNPDFSGYPAIFARPIENCPGGVTRMAMSTVNIYKLLAITDSGGNKMQFQRI